MIIFLIFVDSFTWHQRIRAALGLANFLAFIHSFDQPLLVRNLDAAHVMIDQVCPFNERTSCWLFGHLSQVIFMANVFFGGFCRITMQCYMTSACFQVDISPIGRSS